MALVSWYPFIKNTKDYVFNSGEFNEANVIENSTDGKIYQNNFTASSNIYKTVNIDELTGKNEISIIFWLKLSETTTEESIINFECSRNSSAGNLNVKITGNSITCTHDFFDIISATLDNNYHQILIRIGEKMQMYSDKELIAESELTDVSRTYTYSGSANIYLGSFVIQDLFILNHYVSDYEIQYYAEKPIIRYTFENQTEPNVIINEAIDCFNGTGNLTYVNNTCKGTQSAQLTEQTTIEVSDFPQLNEFTLLFWINASSGQLIKIGNVTITLEQTSIKLNGTEIGSFTPDSESLIALEYNNSNWRYSNNGQNYSESLNLSISYDQNSLELGGFSGVLSEFQLIPNINIDVNEMWNIKANIDNLANFYIGEIKCSGILIKELTNGYIDDNGNIVTSTEYPNAAYSNIYRVYSDISYMYPTLSTQYIRILEYDNNLNYIGIYPGINSGQYTTAEDKFIRFLFLNTTEYGCNSFVFYNSDNDYELNPILVNKEYTTMATGISENLIEENPVFEIYKNDIKARNIYEK